MEMYNPPHPGRLIEDQRGVLPVATLAKRLGLTRAALYRVIQGQAPVGAEMASRLEVVLGVRAGLWLRMQVRRDLWVAGRNQK